MSAKALIHVVAPQPRKRRRSTDLGYKLRLSLVALLVAEAASGVLLTAVRDDAGRSRDGSETAARGVGTASGGGLPAAAMTARLPDSEPPAPAPPAPSPSPSIVERALPESAPRPDVAAHVADDVAATAVAAAAKPGAPAASTSAAPATRPLLTASVGSAAGTSSSTSAAHDAGLAGQPVAGPAGAPDAGAGGDDAGPRRARTEIPVRVTSERDGEHEGEFIRLARFTPVGGASLEGRVVDVDSGRPISGVIVEARLARQLVDRTTDASGSFRIPGMLPGTQVVVWIGGARDPFVSERVEVRVPGEGQVVDTGTVKLLKGDEMGSSSRGGWVGLFVTTRGGRVAVSAVSPWLPADRASLEVGDVLVSIDGRDINGLGARAVTFLLRGPVGSPVKLVAESASGGRRQVLLERVAR